jgi:hypothetical protein
MPQSSIRMPAEKNISKNILQNADPAFIFAPAPEKHTKMHSKLREWRNW